MPARKRLAAAAAAAGAITALGLAAAPAAQASPSGRIPYISLFHKLSTLSSTVPRNGDLNPYGVFVIRHAAGRLQAGNVLVSNFNNKKNLQGTGHTIVQISPSGQFSTFATINPRTLPGKCPGGVGLTTALEVLPGGWVVVGSTPSTNGQAATAKAGCLIVLNSKGQVAETFSGGGINGPWDSTLVQHGPFATMFVTNVLNGTVKANGKVVNGGTVLRLGLVVPRHGKPRIVSDTLVGSDFPQRTDPNAFVLGPTGVALGRSGALYVADTLTSKVTAIPAALFRGHSAGTGFLVTQNGQLNMPLGMALAPNGDILTVNGGNGKIVETTPAGKQVASRFLDTSGSPKGAGALFGLAVKPRFGGVYYVDDAVNTLRLLH